MSAAMQPPHLRNDLFRPGQRVAVAVSGGADSVALLRRLLEVRHELGIVCSITHVHHGIRGAEADADAAFVAALASTYDLPFHLHQTDAPAAAASLHETLEEAARNLRYAWFRQLLAAGEADAVATAHTLDDQAETVLHKLLRGAGTEGLSGIHPVVIAGPGNIVRPFLETDRASIEAWLLHLGQPWREDATNQDMAHTRNRIRHQLLPMLRSFNPQIATQLSRLASISGEEEAYWQAELGRILPSILLSGRPARGGGRSSSTHPDEETVAIELLRLRSLHPAVGRRVVRAVARRLGVRLNFDQTDQLLAMTEAGPRKFELPGGIVAERSLREIRLSRTSAAPDTPVLTFAIPGEIQVSAYGVQLRAEHKQTGQVIVRAWKAGDRVTLRHSRGPRKVAEVLDRLHVLGGDRKTWPVVEWQGTIVWMRGVDVDAPEFVFTVTG
jgi:tRNA(Ile)-lysidine synthase